MKTKEVCWCKMLSSIAKMDISYYLGRQFRFTVHPTKAKVLFILRICLRRKVRSDSTFGEEVEKGIEVNVESSPVVISQLEGFIIILHLQRMALPTPNWFPILSVTCSEKSCGWQTMIFSAIEIDSMVCMTTQRTDYSTQQVNNVSVYSTFANIFYVEIVQS
jgi:hypothetical protein